jgi:hypothetical protein
VTVERGLVGDDEIVAGSGGALEYVEGRHHGRGDAGNGRIGIASFDGVDGLRAPGDADVFLNSIDDVAYGEVGIGGEGDGETRTKQESEASHLNDSFTFASLGKLLASLDGKLQGAVSGGLL